MALASTSQLFANRLGSHIADFTHIDVAKVTTLKIDSNSHSINHDSKLVSIIVNLVIDMTTNNSNSNDRLSSEPQHPQSHGLRRPAFLQPPSGNRVTWRDFILLVYMTILITIILITVILITLNITIMVLKLLVLAPITTITTQKDKCERAQDARGAPALTRV